MSLFEDIAQHGNRWGETFMRTRQNWILLADGTTLSVIAGVGAYCQPRVALYRDLMFSGEMDPLYRGPYTHVEVGFPSVWDGVLAQYEQEDGVAGFVPVEDVRAFIETHGGEATGKLAEAWDEALSDGCEIDDAARLAAEAFADVEDAS